MYSLLEKKICRPREYIRSQCFEYKRGLFCDRMCFLIEYAVVQLGKAPRYNPEGHLYNSRWFHWDSSLTGDRGSTVVKVLCYNSEGRWFDPGWCQWIFH